MFLQINMLCRMDVKIARNFVFILAVSISFLIIVRSFPLGEADRNQREKQRGSSTPCFSHSDCLRTQMCTWNPAVVELVGTCVTQSQHYQSGDQRSRIEERSGRKRRKALSFVDEDNVDERKTHRQARNVDFDDIERHRGGVNERLRKDYTNGEVDNDDMTRQNVEETENKDNDYFGDMKDDEPNPQSQLSRRLPQASYPLSPSHRLPGQNGNDGINSDDEIVIDHFDDKGLPVVVIEEDNRDQHAEIDTNQDFYTFGEEVGDNSPDNDAKTEGIVYDYVDESDVDGRVRNEGEMDEVVIDLKGGRLKPQIQSIFSNPWGVQPIRSRPADDITVDDEYFNDDAQVYGVGDHRHVEPRFRHIDLAGTGMETDVGVDRVGGRRPASRWTSVDQTGIALPGLQTKDLDAHNY